jgi:hypothetical protein
MQDDVDDDALDAGRLKSPHSSPTLAHVARDSIGEPGPPEAVACRDCPVSIWFWKGSDQIVCFCSAMHEKTWGPGTQPILFCDAREQEVAKMLASLAAQRP